jgi:thioredoxin reductase (NADPH)
MEPRDPLAFPILTEAQIALLREHGEGRSLADGEALWRVGDTEFSLFVVLSGRVEIVEDGCAIHKSVAYHAEGEFSGDVDLLSGRPSAVSSYASGPADILEVSAIELRDVIRLDQELGSVILQAFLRRREILRNEGNHGVRIIGSPYDPETLKIREFLQRNRVLFHWKKPEEEGIQALLEQLNFCVEDTPVVLTAGKALKKPTLEDLGLLLGIRKAVDHMRFDLVVVGSGPAGLAAAVYGASEGLHTLVLDRSAPGGQAAWSSKIENYMGFPMGLSGEDLALAGRVQAEKFGAQLSIPSDVESIECADGAHLIHLSTGETIEARAVIVASGARYRKLACPGYDRLQGKGVYYAATVTEAMMCEGSEVAVVGAGNSAGQAVVFLSSRCAHVRLIVRGNDLDKSMSSYLARRVEHLPNVEICLETEVELCEGEDSLTQITLKGARNGCVPCAGLFVFVGADPNTEILRGKVELDSKGFVLTGDRIQAWTQARRPLYLETSCPGIFAAGDCRADSVKRVASGVGEGAMAVAFVHKVLAG